jgi:hypothetical protein
VQVRIERVVAGVSPREATAWWSDFREGPSDHAFLPGSRRVIVERATDHVTMREHAFGLAWELVTAWPGEREVRFVGRNRASTFAGAYRFEEAPGRAAVGTRIVLEAEITLAKGIAWTDAMARPVVLAMLKADLAGHAKEMRKDLARA